MNEEELLLGWLPNRISDETAYELYQILEQLTEVLEQKYYAQIRRHVAGLQPPVPENWAPWRKESNSDE